MTTRHTAEYWRTRAEEVRTKAGEMRDEEFRRVLLYIAESYDTLAAKAEKIESLRPGTE